MRGVSLVLAGSLALAACASAAPSNRPSDRSGPIARLLSTIDLEPLDVQSPEAPRVLAEDLWGIARANGISVPAAGARSTAVQQYRSTMQRLTRFCRLPMSREINPSATAFGVRITDVRACAVVLGGESAPVVRLAIRTSAQDVLRALRHGGDVRTRRWKSHEYWFLKATRIYEAVADGVAIASDSESAMQLAFDTLDGKVSNALSNRDIRGADHHAPVGDALAWTYVPMAYRLRQVIPFAEPAERDAFAAQGLATFTGAFMVNVRPNGDVAISYDTNEPAQARRNVSILRHLVEEGRDWTGVGTAGSPFREQLAFVSARAAANTTTLVIRSRVDPVRTASQVATLIAEGSSVLGVSAGLGND